jgi:hypothetical protein
LSWQGFRRSRRRQQEQCKSKWNRAHGGTSFQMSNG